MPDEIDLLGKNRRNREAVMAEAQAAKQALVKDRIDTEGQLERLDIDDLVVAVGTLSKCKYQMIALLDQRRKLSTQAAG